MVRLAMPDGSIMHATLKIGDSMLMLNDEFPAMDCKGPLSIGGTPVTLHLQVADVDKAFERALKAGAKVKFSPADQFWGARYGIVSDPFGHAWSLATHKQDLTQEQVMQGAAKAFCPPPPSAPTKK
jgi:PhnB protein